MIVYGEQSPSHSGEVSTAASYLQPKGLGGQEHEVKSRLKREHQGPEDQAARPSMVKPVLAEPQSWRKVPILRDGVIAHIRWYGRRYDALIQPAPEPARKREGSDERGTYGRSDDHW